MHSQPTIDIAFVDDWELRGDGSGDPWKLQFEPIRHLARLFKERGMRASFNAELMQQLTFRRWEGLHPQLAKLADEWDEVVRETFLQRHDVQLHLHPQWENATFENGKWVLRSEWSLLKHDPEHIREMVAAGKVYLEQLLRPLNPNYKCVSFRAGSWVIAPSEYILPILADLGILFDTSVVAGVRYHTRRIECDYTCCEEAFLPYFPVMNDARKVAQEPQPIICIPTNQFRAGMLFVIGQDICRLGARAKLKLGLGGGGLRASAPVDGRVAGYNEWKYAGPKRSALVEFTRRVQAHFKALYISDIAQLNYAQLTRMLEKMRERARQSHLPRVPVVLTNHTKDIRDFSHIEKFLDLVAAASDLNAITLTDLAKGLLQGVYLIRTRNGLVRKTAPGRLSAA